MNEKLTILIVDDSKSTRDLVTLILRQTPFTIVGAAANGQEAVEFCKTYLPDVVLLDVVLPGMSGMDAFENIIKVSPKSKVIMLTAVTERSTVLRAKQLGAYDYFLKPIDRNELLARLNKLHEKLLKEKNPA